MTTTTPLLLITADPSHPLAHLALRYARAYLNGAANSDDIDHTDTNSTGTGGSDNATSEQPLLNVFFYGDSAHIANRLRWQSADQLDGWSNAAVTDMPEEPQTGWICFCPPPCVPASCLPRPASSRALRRYRAA